MITTKLENSARFATSTIIVAEMVSLSFKFWKAVLEKPNDRKMPRPRN